VSDQRADPIALRRHVEALEGERHAARSPGRLASARAYVVRKLTALGWKPTLQPFHFHGREHVNVIALRAGADATLPRTLVGAHLDTVAGTPGADDNASGVAGVLEVARLLADTPSSLPIELAVWDLEERTRLTYRVGSRRHVAESRRQGIRYGGALVLEMIGYRSTTPGSQRIPLPVRWMDLPRTGDFLGAIGDMRSRKLLRAFLDAAARVAPSLHVEHLSVPLRGWAVWATRRSDNASFWSNGYPALMLTDTADLRNPHYHRATDRSETLDYSFMSAVVDAVTETARGPVT
jgi:Zn-dependent M28 family amino/carboxypeptidase